MILQFSSQIDGVTAKKDRTLSIKLGTQELSPEDTSKIFELNSKQIWVAMAETELTKSDIEIPDEIPEFQGEKSHSQRLKAVLYILWKEKTDQKKSADQFYRDYMEKLIENVKLKLD